MFTSRVEWFFLGMTPPPYKKNPVYAPVFFDTPGSTYYAQPRWSNPAEMVKIKGFDERNSSE